MEDKKDKLFAMLEKVNVLHKLKSEDKELMGKPLMKRVMQVSQAASSNTAAAAAVRLGSMACVGNGLVRGNLLTLSCFTGTLAQQASSKPNVNNGPMIGDRVMIVWLWWLAVVVAGSWPPACNMAAVSAA